jgi:hypothetical protein
VGACSVSDDEDLVGLWDSTPFDYGVMESSQLGLLADGTGWGVWSNFGGGMELTLLTDDVHPRQRTADLASDGRCRRRATLSRPSSPSTRWPRMKAYNKAVYAAMPSTPYWYLGVLGTRPDRAGRRLGRAVMAAGLRRAAADGLPAILETSNPANVEVYRRAGWEVDVVVKAEPLTIWIMQQKPTG